jgi:hypothetical protein
MSGFTSEYNSHRRYLQTDLILSYDHGLRIFPQYYPYELWQRTCLLQVLPVQVKLH